MFDFDDFADLDYGELDEDAMRALVLRHRREYEALVLESRVTRLEQELALAHQTIAELDLLNPDRVLVPPLSQTANQLGDLVTKYERERAPR